MVEKHILVVMTNAEPGRDAEYNDWYTNRHLTDVLALEGFVAAQRFELAETDPPQEHTYRYLAIYEVPEGQLEQARAALAAAGRDRERRLPSSDAMADARDRWWFTSITDRREA